MGCGVIDVREQTVDCGRRRYTVATASCRVFKAFTCALEAASVDEGKLSEVLYDYLPFFLIYANVGTTMPPATDDWRHAHKVRTADAQWVSDNVPACDFPLLLPAIMAVSTMTDAETAGFTTPVGPASGKRRKKASVSNAPDQSAVSESP